jgi:hypothetical protein
MHKAEAKMLEVEVMQTKGGVLEAPLLEGEVMHIHIYVYR